jgi:hypothetical protein
MKLLWVIINVAILQLVALIDSANAFSIPTRSQSLSGSCQYAQISVSHSAELDSKLSASTSKTKTLGTVAPYLISGVIASLVSLIPEIVHATTEVELADLPPPWIPVVFGLGLVVVRYGLLHQTGSIQIQLTITFMFNFTIGGWFIDRKSR